MVRFDAAWFCMENPLCVVFTPFPNDCLQTMLVKTEGASTSSQNQFVAEGTPMLSHSQMWMMAKSKPEIEKKWDVVTNHGFRSKSTSSPNHSIEPKVWRNRAHFSWHLLVNCRRGPRWRRGSLKNQPFFQGQVWLYRRVMWNGIIWYYWSGYIKRWLLWDWFQTFFKPLPSGNLTQLWKITMFNGKTHYKWQFSIANC